VSTVDSPPRENVTYSKETQTPATDVVIDKDGNFGQLLFDRSMLQANFSYFFSAKPLDYYGSFS